MIEDACLFCEILKIKHPLLAVDIHRLYVNAEVIKTEETIDAPSTSNSKHAALHQQIQRDLSVVCWEHDRYLERKIVKCLNDFLRAHRGYRLFPVLTLAAREDLQELAVHHQLEVLFVLLINPRA